MRNGTINYNKETNDRINEIQELTTAKRVGAQQHYWFQKLNAAFNWSASKYQQAIYNMRKDLAESRKAPRWDMHKIKERNI